MIKKKKLEEKTTSPVLKFQLFHNSASFLTLWEPRGIMLPQDCKFSMFTVKTAGAKGKWFAGKVKSLRIRSFFYFFKCMGEYYISVVFKCTWSSIIKEHKLSRDATHACKRLLVIVIDPPKAPPPTSWSLISLLLGNYRPGCTLYEIIPMPTLTALVSVATQRRSRQVTQGQKQKTKTKIQYFGKSVPLF